MLPLMLLNKLQGLTQKLSSWTNLRTEYVQYTLVSYAYVVQDITGSAIYSPLQQAVLAMVEAAFGAINLELHSGTHPRLGVVDNILFHPLAQASLDEAAWLAKVVAADITNQFQGQSNPSKASSNCCQVK